MLGGSNILRGSAEMSKALLPDMIPELQLALQGRMTERHRFLRRQLLDCLRFTESERSEIEQDIDRRMRSFRDEVTRRRTIPRVDQVTPSGILSEVGLDMNGFRLPSTCLLGLVCAPAILRAPGNCSAPRCGRATFRCAGVCPRRLGRCR